MASSYSFYTIIPDGFRFAKSDDMSKYPFIIDSGTSILWLPSGKLA